MAIIGDSILNGLIQERLSRKRRAVKKHPNSKVVISTAILRTDVGKAVLTISQLFYHLLRLDVDVIDRTNRTSRTSNSDN